MWLLLVALFIGILFYKKCIKPLYYWDEKNVPNVRGWPIIGKQGHVILNKITPAQWLRDAYLEFPDRRYSGSSQFNRPALVVRDPALIKDLTIKYFDNFTNRINIVPKDVDPIMGNSLIFLRDHEWKSMRSNLSPAFTLTKMKTMFELILETSNRFCSYHLAKATTTIPVNMGDAGARFANDVIATCAFDITCNSLEEKDNVFYTMGKIVSNFALGRVLKVLLYTYLKPIFKIVNLGFFSNKVNNFFMNIILNKISLRRDFGNSREDMIYLLMEAQKGKLKHEEGPNTHAGFATVDESPEDKKIIKRNISDQDIVSQCLTFFFGGVTTVTNPVCLMSYELAINPDVQAKLIEEIDSTYDQCEGKYTYNDILGMKYLDMVVSEVLRKWPPVHVLRRECRKDFILHAETPEESDFTVEAGTGLIIPIIGIHYDEKYYSNPNEFDPERFNDENRKKILPYTYLPFGSGPRNCIASRFALLEMKTFFVALLSNFEIVPIDKTVLPITLNETSTGECWVGFKARSRSQNISS